MTQQLLQTTGLALPFPSK